jgi:hypothetical protein
MGRGPAGCVSGTANGKVTVHASEWKERMNGWVNMLVSIAVLLSRRRKWAVLKQDSVWMVVILCGFMEKKWHRLWCLFLTVHQLCLGVSGQAVNYASVSRECIESVKSEVAVKCANDTTACVWRHHYINLSYEGAVSTQTYQTMLDMIVVLCNGQLGVAVRQQ